MMNIGIFELIKHQTSIQEALKSYKVKKSVYSIKHSISIDGSAK